MVNFIGNYEERGNELSLFKILMAGFIVCENDGNNLLGQLEKDVWCSVVWTQDLLSPEQLFGV